MFLALIYEKFFNHKPAVKTFGAISETIDQRQILDILKHMVMDEWLDGEEKPDWYERIVLYEIKQEIKVPLADWFAEGDKIVAAREAKEKEEAERAELERLKKKYG